jgi:hypothetical protein
MASDESFPVESRLASKLRLLASKLPLSVPVLTFVAVSRPPHPNAATSAVVAMRRAERIMGLLSQSKNPAHRNAAESGRGRGPCCATGPGLA